MRWVPYRASFGTNTAILDTCDARCCNGALVALPLFGPPADYDVSLDPTRSTHLPDDAEAMPSAKESCDSVYCVDSVPKNAPPASNTPIWELEAIDSAATLVGGTELSPAGSLEQDEAYSVCHGAAEYVKEASRPAEVECGAVEPAAHQAPLLGDAESAPMGVLAQKKVPIVRRDDAEHVAEAASPVSVKQGAIEPVAQVAPRKPTRKQRAYAAKLKAAFFAVHRLVLNADHVFLKCK